MMLGKELLDVLFIYYYLGHILIKTERDDRFHRVVSSDPSAITPWLAPRCSIDHSNMQLSHTGIHRSPIFSISGIAPCFSKPKHMLFKDSCACELPCYSICCQSGYCSLLFSFLFCMCLLFVLFFFWNYLTMKHFVFSYLPSYLA